MRQMLSLRVQVVTEMYREADQIESKPTFTQQKMLLKQHTIVIVYNFNNNWQAIKIKQRARCTDFLSTSSRRRSAVKRLRCLRPVAIIHRSKTSAL